MDSLQDIERILVERGQHLLLIVAVLLGVGVVAFIGRFIQNAYFSPLSSYPGPKLWAGSRFPSFWYSTRGKHTHKMRQLHEKYGPVVRSGPTELSYITGTAWKTIYGHRSVEMAKTIDGRGGILPPVGGGHSLITAPRADHARLRRNVAHAFSEKALRDQESYIQDYVDQLVAGLKAAAATGKPQDMLRWYNFTTFDVIGDLAFGEPFGCLQNNTYHEWVTSIFKAVKSNPWLQLTRYYKLLGYFPSYVVPKELGEARLSNYRTSVDKMNRRMARTDDRKDFTSYMMRHSDEKGLTKMELQNMAQLLIIAGSETTATLLTGATFHILNNPHVYERLVKEIRDRFKNEEDITLVAVNELKYLLAVLEEGLRMYPPVPTNLPRIVPGDGEFIDGKFVPAGTAVGVHQFATFTSEQNFHRAKEFLPERWLHEEDGGSPEFANDDKTAFQPFSFGPRNCVGRNLAYAEMRLIIARVLFNFDLKLDESCRDWEDQLAPFLWDKKPMVATLTPVH